MKTHNPTIAQNIWFGHYSPQAVKSLTVSDAQAHELKRIAEKPITHPQGGEEFFNVSGDILPSFTKMRHALIAHRAQFFMQDEMPSAAFARDRATKQEYVILPMAKRPVDYLVSLINSVTPLVTPPQGITIPGIQPVNSIEEAHKMLWANYCWNVALAQSLTYQVAIEMERAGVQMITAPYRMTHMTATDLALFRILRDRGLEGVAKDYPKYMSPDMKVMQERNIMQQAQLLVEGGASTFSWTPTVREGKPSIPRTVIDDYVDELTPLEDGLYMRVKGLAALTDEERSELDSRLFGTVLDSDDIDDVLFAVEKLAPPLASRILTPEARSVIKYEIVSNMMPGHPVSSQDSIAGLLGLPRQGKDDSVTILVQEGAPKQTVMIDIVKFLARAVLPAIMNEREQVASMSQDEIFRAIMHMFARSDIWGYSAMFEFINEAAQRGYRIPISDHHDKMRKVLDDCGFGVLCEQWYLFTDPQAYQFMTLQFKEVARQISQGLLQ